MSLPLPGLLAAYLMLGFLLLATALAQVAFKQHHLSGHRRWLWAAIALFACNPPIALLVVRRLGIGEVYVLMSLGYALVALLGWKLFGERITGKQLQGLALITLGCLAYAF